MQIPEPQAEHRWLQRLIGEWTYESECEMGPGQPPMKTSGRESVRALGPLWTIGEWTGEAPGGGSSRSIMTLGYDPAQQRFVGTFLTDMMTHLWPYLGTLDANGRVLTLNSTGPSFSGDGTLAQYQDLIEFVNDDERMLTSQVQGPDGQWTRFMSARFRRQK